VDHPRPAPIILSAFCVTLPAFSRDEFGRVLDTTRQSNNYFILLLLKVYQALALVPYSSLPFFSSHYCSAIQCLNNYTVCRTNDSLLFYLQDAHVSIEGKIEFAAVEVRDILLIYFRFIKLV